MIVDVIEFAGIDWPIQAQLGEVPLRRVVPRPEIVEADGRRRDAGGSQVAEGQGLVGTQAEERRTGERVETRGK